MATRTWVEKVLAPGERIEGAERLRGGWTSQMRRLDVGRTDLAPEVLTAHLEGNVECLLDRFA